MFGHAPLVLWTGLYCTANGVLPSDTFCGRQSQFSHSNKIMRHKSAVRVATKRQHTVYLLQYSRQHTVYLLQYKVNLRVQHAKYAYLEEAEADGSKPSLIHARGLHHDAVSQSIHQTATHVGPDAQDELVLRHLPRATPSTSTLTLTSFTPLVRYLVQPKRRESLQTRIAVIISLQPGA